VQVHGLVIRVYHLRKQLLRSTFPQKCGVGMKRRDKSYVETGRSEFCCVGPEHELTHTSAVLYSMMNATCRFIIVFIKVEQLLLNAI
ncbi:hypothetical protein KIL84_015458, partial [Mauremys mutica]